jgi:GWxTD domain-containing protein
MILRWVPVAGLLGLVAGSQPLRGQESQSLELAAARFYRAGPGQTVVDLFCRVPFGLLDPLTRGAGGRAIYRVSVSVRDSAGLELVGQTWNDVAPAALLQEARASAVQHVAFAVRPGRYQVEVQVKDSATGRVGRARMEVAAFAESAPPRASDLVLANSIRRAADANDTVSRPGEIRKGGLFLQAAGRPVLTPQAADLGYYWELYPARAETASVVFKVQTADGRQLVATQPQRLPLDPQGGVSRGMVPLVGLPPGVYQLEATATLGDSAVVRRAEFRMAGFETEAAVAAAARTQRTEGFEGMTDAELDELYAPLVYIMQSDEQGIYPTLSSEGKRNFLRQFWAKRDPTPGTAGNEEQSRFYRAIAEANRRFREGGAGAIPGWRTDRGRVFIRYGPPDEVLSRPQPMGTQPYEVWKYTQVRSRKFVFMDFTAFGNFSLIWTDERREPSRPNWQELLGREAVEEVARF